MKNLALDEILKNFLVYKQQMIAIQAECERISASKIGKVPPFKI